MQQKDISHKVGKQKKTAEKIWSSDLETKSNYNLKAKKGRNKCFQLKSSKRVKCVFVLLNC